MGLIAVTLLLSLAGTTEPAQADVVPKMRDPKLPAVLTVTINENGATSPAAGSSNEGCGSFILRERDVLEYLHKAKAVTQHDYFHMLDWSPCYASGIVTFKNGATGTWGIQQFRSGSLRLSTGKQYFLYCPTCRARTLQPPVGQQ